MVWPIKLKSILSFFILPILIGITFFYGFHLYKLPREKLIEDKHNDPKLLSLKIMDEHSNSRPVGYMIDNEGGSWPHSGLQDAYLVYEIIIEGGESRYFALFKDKTNTIVGPNRSARHYFIDYALENDAFYVHYGHSPQALKDINLLNIDDIDGLGRDGGIFYRVAPLSSYHNVFTKVEDAIDRAKKNKYELTTNQKPLLDYSLTPVSLNNNDEATIATYLKITYSNVHYIEYKYDEQSKVYKRLLRGKEHYDRNTNEQYTVKNIIVYSVKNYNLGDGSGRQELTNIGKGKGYYITEGYSIPITWEKTKRAGKTIYKDIRGNTIKLNDGNTFIQIMPLNQPLIID